MIFTQFSKQMHTVKSLTVIQNIFSYLFLLIILVWRRPFLVSYSTNLHDYWSFAPIQNTHTEQKCWPSTPVRLQGHNTLDYILYLFFVRWPGATVWKEMRLNCLYLNGYSYSRPRLWAVCANHYITGSLYIHIGNYFIKPTIELVTSMVWSSRSTISKLSMKAGRRASIWKLR